MRGGGRGNLRGSEREGICGGVRGRGVGVRVRGGGRENLWGSVNKLPLTYSN